MRPSIPRADRVVRRLVDQDEAAGRAVAAVGVDHQRRAERRCTRPISLSAELGRSSTCSSVLTSTRYSSSLDDRPRRAGRVLDRVAAAGLQRLRRSSSRPSPRARGRRPAGRRRRRSCRRGRCRGRRSSRSVTDIGGNAASSSPSKVSIAAIRRPLAAGQHHHLVAGAQHAAGDLAGVAAVVVVLVGSSAGSPTGPGSARRRGCGRRRSRRARGGRAAAGRRTSACCRERSTTLSPCSAEIGMNVRSGIVEPRGPVGQLVDDRVEHRPRRSRRGPSC